MSWKVDPREAPLFLAKALQRSGESQKSLGLRIGTTQPTISEFMRRTRPRFLVDTLIRIATGLGYRVWIVFEKIEPPDR